MPSAQLFLLGAFGFPGLERAVTFHFDVHPVKQTMKKLKPVHSAAALCQPKIPISCSGI